MFWNNSDNKNSIAFSGWDGHSVHNFHDVKAVVVSHEFVNQTENPRIPLVCQKTGPLASPTNFQRDDPLNVSFGLILIDIVLVVLITQIVRFLLRPLRQPRFVSEIIGGTIIGPSVLGRNKKFSATFLPENAKFVVKNIGIMGFMLFLFVIGVKMDISLFVKAERKHRLAALISMCIPLVTVAMIAYIIRPSMDNELAKASSIQAVGASLAVTGFYVIFPVLQELNLLSSEIGRMALSVSIIIDVAGLVLMHVYQAMKNAETSAKAFTWFIISAVLLIAFTMISLRRAMGRIVIRTPPGEPVKQACVVVILMGVWLMGFLSDTFGMGIANGPLWLGLVIPDGPPLGSTIVDKTETLMRELFMPFSFMFVGMFVDISAMINVAWSSLAPLFLMIIAGYISKFLATLGASFLIGMRLKEGLTFSLIMSLRGQLEMILAIHWLDKFIIGIPSFTMVILLTTAVTAIATPLISILYDPTRPYRVSRRRTVQHTPPCAELRIVACIHDEESVASLINLFEFSFPTVRSPFSVYAIHLIELIGRAAPMFIDHENDKMPSKYVAYKSAHNALKLYQETRDEVIKLNAFTAIVPKKTMYQNISALSLASEAVLIILPFNKEWSDNSSVTKAKQHDRAPSSVISSVLEHAPCSVGIFVHKGGFMNPLSTRSFQSSTQHFILLFLGGADAREALVYAERTLMNPDVRLTVIRFIAHSHGREDEAEKKLDDGVVTWFWARNEGNRRLAYREVAVRNGEETLGAIQSLNDMEYDLWIMGREKGINPVLLNGLSNWSHHFELGVVGDFVSSSDFDSTASVLVLQQQILRQ